MKRLFVLLAVSLPLIACNSEELNDGYQFGDIAHLTNRELAELKQARDDYCDKTQDSVLRYAALKVVRLYFPLLPENGICGSFMISAAANEPNR